jgi:glutathione synthase
MRQDPPFDLGYISAALLLDRLKGTTLVVNDPKSVINAPEKMFVLDYARFMPPTLVARRIEDVRAFQQRTARWWSSRSTATAARRSSRSSRRDQPQRDHRAVRPGLARAVHGPAVPPEVAEGDKRIVLVDGEFAGAINRKPGEGEFRSNLAQGGYAEAATLTAREEEICAAMGPELKARGLVFVGIDVIGGKWLTEINVTSPTGSSPSTRSTAPTPPRASGMRSRRNSDLCFRRRPPSRLASPCTI